MESLKIEVTSNSTPESILKDFQNCSQVSKLDISLEIQADHEELILKSIVDQIHQIGYLEDISITIEPSCILEHFQIFTEGLSTLKFIKSLIVKFSSTCFAGQTQFSHLASAIKSLSLLTNLSILVDEKNYFDKSQVALLSECFLTLKELTTLKIQISHGNSFSDQAITELSKGLAKITNLKDLSLSLDFSKVYSEGMVQFGNTIKNLKQLSKLELTLLNKCATHTDIKQVFESITTLSQLKSLLIDPQNTLQLQQSILEKIIQDFSNLTQLESLSLLNFFGEQEALENHLLIQNVSNLTQLKHLNAQIMNFIQLNNENIDGSTDYLNKLVNLTHLNLKIKDVEKTRNNQFVSILSTSIIQMKELISLKIAFECKTEKEQSLSFVDSIKGLLNLNSLDLVFLDKFFLDSDIYNSLSESLQSLQNLKSLSLFTNKSRKPFGSEKSIVILTKNRFLNSLTSLSKLEELQLKGMEIEKENNETLVETLQNLVSLKKLNISSFYSFAEVNTFDIFSKPLNELKNLTDLNFSVYNDQKYSNGNLQFFNYLTQLENLQNLKLFIEEDDGNIFQQLGNIFSCFNQLITLTIKCSTCSLLSIKNIVSSLQSAQLKELTLEIDTLNADPTNLDNMFEGIQNLQIFKLVINYNYIKNFGNILFLSLQRLTNLNSFHIECRNLFQAEDHDIYQSISDFLKQQQNLLSFKLKDDYAKVVNNEVFHILREGLESLKKLRVLELDFQFLKDKVNCSLVHTSAGIKNLREISQSSDNNIITNFKQIDEQNCSRYLTQLRLFSSPYSKQRDMFVKAFRSLRYFKYLNTFSLESEYQSGLNSDEITVLGSSLQCIYNLQQLFLIFSFHGDVSEEAIFQLSQGIRCQQELQVMELEIDLQDVNNYTRINSIASSIKYLTDLERIKVYFIILYRLQKEPEFNFFEILGKSIADHFHLKNIKLIIRDSSNIVKISTIQLKNFLSNPILQKMILLNTYNIISFRDMQICQDLSHLTQLQDLRIQFVKSENTANQELLRFCENLKYLESLRNLSLLFFESCVQNPLLIKTITENVQNLKFLTKIDLIFHNFKNIEQEPLEIESILRNQQVQLSTNGELSLQTYTREPELKTYISLKSNNFVFALLIYQETEDVMKDFIFQIEKLVQNIPKNFKISLELNDTLTNNLEDFVKVISQIQSSEMSLSLQNNNSFNDGLVGILEGVSNMTNLIKLELDLSGNYLSHELMISSLQQLSNSKNLQYLNIRHYEAVFSSKCVDISNFNKYIRTLGQLKNLKQLLIHSPFLNKDLSQSSYRLLTHRLLPKLVDFSLSNKRTSSQVDTDPQQFDHYFYLDNQLQSEQQISSEDEDDHMYDESEEFLL